LGTTLFPAFGHYQATHAARLDELFLRPCKYLAILMAPMVAVLCAFSHELLDLWLGREFSMQARVVFPVLAVTFFLNGLAAIPYVTVQGLGRADIKTRLDLAEVVVFLALTAWLVRWGIDGVAFAKLTITILDGVALLWASHRLIGFTSTGIQASRAIEAILVCAGYAAAIIVVRLIPLNLVARSLAVSAATIAFMALSWRFALDDRDKGLIRGITNPWRFRPTV
jgi:O-antigen/teichoic acid export membrane protein